MWFFHCLIFLHTFIASIELLTSTSVSAAEIDCITVLQSIVGVAGGATRAALTEHQARRNNMADVSAKDGSQVLHA